MVGGEGFQDDQGLTPKNPFIFGAPLLLTETRAIDNWCRG